MATFKGYAPPSKPMAAPPSKPASKPSTTFFMAPPPISKFKDPVLPKGHVSAPKPLGRSRSGYKTGGGFKNGGAIKKAGKK
jgi:hypothetical protein